MPQSESSSASGNVRKLTQRPEVEAILTPPATSDSPPPPPPSGPPPGSGTATLRWNTNTESNLAGYRVYIGLASGVYGPPIDVGNVTSFFVTGLAEGFTYFFTITAYNHGRHESGFSNEGSKSIF